jgi:hypothetical protein
MVKGLQVAVNEDEIAANAAGFMANGGCFALKRRAVTVKRARSP